MAALEENISAAVSAATPDPVVPVVQPAVEASSDGGADPVLAAIVDALSRALELHDYRRGVYGETAAHTERVTQLAVRLARRVAPELAGDPQLAAGFKLHDIGMIGVPTSVVAKPGPLTRDEVNEIQEHAWLGERIVAPIAALGPLTRQVVACHHERWDGSGYPRGLRGEQIPLSARIFAVVDAYDSMTNPQPYREATSTAVALAEIQAGAGKAFDPAVATELVSMLANELGTPGAYATVNGNGRNGSSPEDPGLPPTD
jgi:HD-GYP domain-containing protein (c-di-GMP phosphodiesterase class II)